MKQTVLAFLVALAFFTSPVHAGEDTVSVYLIRGGVARDEVVKDNLSDLELEKEPLFSSSDIVSFSTRTSGMELTPSACAKVKAIRWGTPFVVSVGSCRVYSGAFWSSISSVSYDGVVILQSPQADNCVFTLELGYPSVKYYSGADKQLDRRIVRSLEAAGKAK